jgi:hypothetical protein
MEPYWVKKYTCPLSLASEMMIIGYSDGGGLGMFMNYQSVMVTKVVAIDFWNYNTYDQWLEQSPGITGGDTVDAVVYAACKSPFFGADGPKAVTPMSAHPSAKTYVEGAGLDTATPGYTAPTATVQLALPCGSQTNCEWHNFKWQDACGKKKVEFFIHGLDSNANGASPAPDADSASWSDTGSGWCTANAIASPTHSNIWNSIPVKSDVFKWLDSTGADFGTCGTGRRLGERKPNAIEGKWKTGASVYKRASAVAQYLEESYANGDDPFAMNSKFYDKQAVDEKSMEFDYEDACKHAKSFKNVNPKTIEACSPTKDYFDIEAGKAESAYSGTDSTYKYRFGGETPVLAPGYVSKV